MAAEEAQVAASNGNVNSTGVLPGATSSTPFHVGNNEPTPWFIVTAIILIAFVGTSVKGVEPVVTTLLLVILVGMILLGYGNIHAIFVNLGIAPSTATKGAGAGAVGTAP